MKIPSAHHLNMELDDVASLTRPSCTARQIQDPPASLMGLNYPRFRETPRNVIWNEIQCLVREEFSLKERQLIPHRTMQESSPLHNIVLQVHMAVGFKLSNMEPYDGTSDPYEHINYYRTIMHIQ